VNPPRVRRISAVTALGVVVLATLAGCAAPTPAVQPTSTPVAVPPAVFSVPAASPNDLLRLIYRKVSDTQETNITIPANATGFSMTAACESRSADSGIGWAITPAAGGASISSARVRCDGKTYLDSAIVAGPGEAIHVTLTGDLSEVREAYLILQPSS
jgi:hypothetical protein